MATSAPPSVAAPISGLARMLVQHQKLDAELATALLKRSASESVPLIELLVSSNQVSAKEIARIGSETFGIPIFDLNSLDQSFLPDKVIDQKLIQELRVIALQKRGNRVSVAIADPTEHAALDRIKFQTQLAVDPVLVEYDKLMSFVNKSGQTASVALAALVNENIAAEFAENDQPAQPTIETNSDIDDAPVVRFLQKLLVDAIEMGASDLHFEPYEKTYRIRYRVDGVLREMSQPPVAIKDKLASRVKVISKLDISEKRIPQDGRMKLVLSQSRAIDFRVSTLPTLFGEKIVMRILDPSSAKLGIDALGYEPDQKAVLMDAIQRPYGMVLVTGPTGSGKTVSLYTCLNILNQPGINIATAEDPAEINLPGINQVNVNDKAGLTFAAALKAFLRQDPDVIMVGEIRDLETADISIKAAQTGHMVFSTLHTNDAPTTLTRMMNMGVAPFNIASSVIMITAQRLARKLCSCKDLMPINADTLLAAGFSEVDIDGSWQPYRPVGCERCNGTGYKGRVGIYQVMPISEAMQKIILTQGNAMQLAEQAQREGVRNLRQSGLLKAKQGLTSIDEILGVTNA